MSNSKSRLDKQIQPIVNQEINQLPFPIRCNITKVYEDDFHVDVNTEHGVLKYAETIGNNLEVGNLGIVLFLGNSFEDYVILTK